MSLKLELQVFGFNTGRLYQANGQRISVGYSEDINDFGVWFNDHSRGIWGKLRVEAIGFMSDWLEADDNRDRAKWLMFYYDRGLYQTDIEIAPRLDAQEWPEWRVTNS